MRSNSASVRRLALDSASPSEAIEKQTMLASAGRRKRASGTASPSAASKAWRARTVSASTAPSPSGPKPIVRPLSQVAAAPAAERDPSSVDDHLPSPNPAQSRYGASKADTA